MVTLPLEKTWSRIFSEVSEASWPTWGRIGSRYSASPSPPESSLRKKFPHKLLVVRRNHNRENSGTFYIRNGKKDEWWTTECWAFHENYRAMMIMSPFKEGIGVRFIFLGLPSSVHSFIPISPSSWLLYLSSSFYFPFLL